MPQRRKSMQTLAQTGTTSKEMPQPHATLRPRNRSNSTSSIATRGAAKRKYSHADPGPEFNHWRLKDFVSNNVANRQRGGSVGSSGTSIDTYGQERRPSLPNVEHWRLPGTFRRPRRATNSRTSSTTPTATTATSTTTRAQSGSTLPPSVYYTLDRSTSSPVLSPGHVPAPHRAVSGATAGQQHPASVPMDTSDAASLMRARGYSLPGHMGPTPGRGFMMPPPPRGYVYGRPPMPVSGDGYPTMQPVMPPPMPIFADSRRWDDLMQVANFEMQALRVPSYPRRVNLSHPIEEPEPGT